MLIAEIQFSNPWRNMVGMLFFVAQKTINDLVYDWSPQKSQQFSDFSPKFHVLILQNPQCLDRFVNSPRFVFQFCIPSRRSSQRLCQQGLCGDGHPSAQSQSAPPALKKLHLLRMRSGCLPTKQDYLNYRNVGWTNMGLWSRFKVSLVSLTAIYIGLSWIIHKNTHIF